MRTFLLYLAAGLLVTAGTNAAAAEWTQLRGTRGGHSSAVGLPLEWSEEHNVAWKRALPGRGFSSPVVLDGQIWLTTAFEDEPSLHALALDEESGAVIHDIEVFRPASWQDSHLENSYASPTPVIEAGRVYVHFGTYGTAALDTADGKVIWRNDSLHIEHEVGPGSSPILFENLLVVHFDGTDQQFVAALDKATGAVVWKAPRFFESDEKGPHRKAFATPIVVHHLGRPQLVSPGADQVSGLDPRTGEEIWRVRYEGYSVVPQPVAGLGRVFVDTGYIKPHLLAIRLGGRGDVTESHVEWNYHWQVPANPSPLMVGDRIFMVSDWGIASWLDARRGEDLWRQRLGGRYWASPLYAHGRVYLFAADGESLVLAAADEYRQLAVNRLEAEIRATPAISGRAFFVRSATHLYRIEELADAGSNDERP